MNAPVRFVFLLLLFALPQPYAFTQTSASPVATEQGNAKAQNANNDPNTDIFSKCLSAVTNCEIYSIKYEVLNEKKTLEIVTTKSTWKTFWENLTRTLPVLIVTCIVLMLLWRIGKCYFTCKCAECHKPCNVFSNQH